MATPYGDAAELASLLQELTARSVSDQVAAVQRYRQLMERIAAGGVDPAAVRAQYDRLVAEQSAQLARDVSALGMRFYQSMLDLNRAYVDRLFDELAGVAGAARPDGPGTAPPPEPAPAPLELALRGAPGEEARTTFVVENKRPEPADVTFLVSDLAPAEGGAPVRAAIELDPPRFRLEPRADRQVSLRLALDPALFAPGRRYDGEVLVRAHDDLTLRLRVDVEPAP